MRDAARRNAQIVLLLLVLVFTAPSLADQTQPGTVPSDTAITLQRGACEKRCAVYALTIRADGTVVFDGQYYVRKTGRSESRIRPAVVRNLIEQFEAIDYFSLRADYGDRDIAGCESLKVDAPIATISIVLAGRAKSVVHHHRCIGPVPSQLTRLEDAIDHAGNAARWIR